MDDFTIISYPGSNKRSLLSLTESRSAYMLPFGGRFRTVDFTIRNAQFSGARETIIYNDIKDNLDDYISYYLVSEEENEAAPANIKVVTKDYSDIGMCYNLIMDANSDIYIIYNGDVPALIDFSVLLKKFKKNRNDSVLYQLKHNGITSMAYKILIIKQKKLLKIINSAIDKEMTSPNIFEMVINKIINKGVKTDTFDAIYWPVKNIPEYYDLHWKIIWDPTIFDMLFNEKIIKSQLLKEGFAEVGPYGKITKSFISDFCYINGTVENSIIYPGVHIEEGSRIKNSIILPFVKIGRDVVINRSIIDERTDLHSDIDYYNIGSMCKIGTQQDHIKNNDYPQSLFSSITLIGKDNRIPPDSRIGGACYVNSNSGENFFNKQKVLYDGVSII